HVHICCIVFSADCAWSRVHTATLNLGFRIVRTGGCHACALHFSRNHNATQRTLVAISSGGRFDVCVCLHCHSDGVFGATARAVGGQLFSALFIAGCLGRGHIRLLCGEVAGQPSNVAAGQPEQNLGRGGGFSPCEHRSWHVDVSLRRADFDGFVACTFN